MRYSAARHSLVFLALVACAASGCKKQQVKDHEPEPEAKADEPFTWRDALASSPDEFEAAVGAFRDCKAVSPKRMRRRFDATPSYPSDGGRWRFCVVGDDAKPHHPDYAIRAVTYAAEGAVVRAK